jgi:cyclic pyranopterin phosphate synthase
LNWTLARESTTSSKLDSDAWNGMQLEDRLHRALGSLRISVTDRCNLRCSYCMPEEEYVWLERSALLRFEEIQRLASVFAGLGTRKLRLTGGEPLLRRDLHRLVLLLAGTPGIADLALTTNGILLGEQASELRRAGLSRLTVSLDTLRRERFQATTKRDELPRVLAGIEAASAAGFAPLKLNCVVQRGINDDEILELLGYARTRGAEMRFIEYMDVGGATRWDPSLVVSRAEILERIREREAVEAVADGDPAAPAERFRLSDGTVFGIIASTTAPFCALCDRARLTADGRLFLCLYAREGTDLARPLRGGASDDELSAIVRASWTRRTDRGAEERLALVDRRVLAAPVELQADPHLEMHTRGG